MNCSLLDDEDYVKDITEKIPIWLAKGRKDFSESRSVWELIEIQYKSTHNSSFEKKRAGKK